MPLLEDYTVLLLANHPGLEVWKGSVDMHIRGCVSIQDRRCHISLLLVRGGDVTNLPDKYLVTDGLIEPWHAVVFEDPMVC